MIRVDELERTPGVRLIVLNVANPGQVPVSPDALTADPLQLRYPWRNTTAASELLPTFGKAMAQERTLGGVVDRVRGDVRGNGNLAAEPSDSLPPEVRARSISAENP